MHDQCTNCLQIPFDGLPIIVQVNDEAPEAFYSWKCLAAYAHKIRRESGERDGR